LAITNIATTSIPISGHPGFVHLSDDGKASVTVANLLAIPVTIPRNAYLGHVERFEARQLSELRLKDDEAPLSEGPLSQGPSKDKRTFLSEAMASKLASLSPSDAKGYMDLILKNHDVFSHGKHDLGLTEAFEHKITLSDPEPVYVKQFRIPEQHRSVLLTHLNKWIELGIVQPSKSRYNSPIFCVAKKDGTLRPVLDFRSLNDKSHMDKYSGREVQDCIDGIGRCQSKIFSCLDLTSGYWQMPLDKNSRSYTCFTIPGIGSFEWLVSPFGLKGCPASFGRLMDFIMRGLKCITYQDDILCHSQTHTEMLNDLQDCFDRLRANKLKLNLGKCNFGQTNVPYLGFTLTDKGILPGVDKTRAITEFKPPSNIRQVREFIGLCNYFRASVPNFSLLSQHLTRLIKKDSGWHGGELPKDSLDAFCKLKTALTTPPVLAYPNPKLEYSLLVDSALGSDEYPGGLGACIVQTDRHGNPRPIAYASRGLSPHEKNYSIYLLELTAATFGIQHFDVYLRGKHFSLYTDHRPLEKLSKVHTRTLNRLQQLMLEYDFQIFYKPGKDHPVPDFLSRNPISSVDILPAELYKLQQQDELISKLIHDLKSGANSSPLFQRLSKKLALTNDILWHTGRSRPAIFAPKCLQGQIMTAAHNSLAGGHMGIFKTHERILEKYYWPSMTRDIGEHIKFCMVCQKTRPYNHPNSAPLKALQQPPSPNHRVHIDLFGPLISSESGKHYVLVMTDAFTKYTELAAIKNKEAETVANAFFVRWVLRYSTPFSILSDNGKEFLNKFMKKLCSELNILHKNTSSYHPQTNATAELFNKVMKRYLQSVLDPPFLDWESYLPHLQFCYNTSISKATKFSPSHLLYGLDSPMSTFALDKYVDYTTDGAFSHLTRLHTSRKHAIANNLEYKASYTSYHDKANKVQKPQFGEGDFIMLKVQAKQKFKNAKFHPLYEGPFEVTSASETNVTYTHAGKSFTVHVNRVKLAILPDSGAPTQPDKATVRKPTGARPKQAPYTAHLAGRGYEKASTFIEPDSEDEPAQEEDMQPQADQPSFATPSFSSYRERQAQSDSDNEDSPSSQVYLSPEGASFRVYDDSPEGAASLPLCPQDATMMSLPPDTPSKSPFKKMTQAISRQFAKRSAQSPPASMPLPKEQRNEPSCLADELLLSRATRSTRPNMPDLPLPTRPLEYKEYTKKS
jgi:hypothetical protein